LKLINHQLIKIKFTLNKIGNWQHLLLLKNWPNGATEHDPGDREAVPGDQGAAVIPDDVTVHEEIRPETHSLVRTTEVSK
jgi:hypothetical protein